MRLFPRLRNLQPPPEITRDDVRLYYGGGNTIHRTGHLDIVVEDHRVVEVWYRCLQLPFSVSSRDFVGSPLYSDHRDELPRITGIEVLDR